MGGAREGGMAVVAAPHLTGYLIFAEMVVAGTADPTPRLDPPRGGLPPTDGARRHDEEMSDLRRFTDGGVRLRGETPLGSSQPRDRDDVASDENGA